MAKQSLEFLQQLLRMKLTWRMNLCLWEKKKRKRNVLGNKEVYFSIANLLELTFEYGFKHRTLLNHGIPLVSFLYDKKCLIFFFSLRKIA